MFTVSILEGIAKIDITYVSKRKLKILVSHENQSISYPVTSHLVMPLTFGNGKYHFYLCEQNTNSNYTVKKRITKTVKLNNPKAYQLIANDYVPFNKNSTFYIKAKELKTWSNIWKFLTSSVAYDYIGAILNAKKPFSPPDLDKTFTSKKGICYDLSALAAAMARINDIPVAVVVGKANQNNHAWIEIEGKKYDIVKELTKNKKSYTYIAERYY